MPENYEPVDGKNDSNTTQKRLKNMKRLAVIIGILILLIIVVILLLRGCQNYEPPHETVDIPGNVIDPVAPAMPKASLKLNSANAEENLSFEASGMDGGSKVSHLYRVVATYNSNFTLKYDMTVRDNQGFEILAEALKIKVELVGAEGDTLLYDGLMGTMPPLELALAATGDTTTEHLFRVTAYLDSPLGDRYYGRGLIADMSWWVDGQDNVSVANNEFSTVIKIAPPPPAVEAPTFDFVQLAEGDNTPFHMDDVKKGASQTRYFAFEITHGDDVTVLINNEIVVDSNLHDAMHVKVELVGEDGNVTVYEGLLKDLSVEHTIPKNDSGKTSVYYKVTVTADSFTYLQSDSKLVCDLSWALEGTSEQLKVPNNKFETFVRPYYPSAPPPPQTAISIELTPEEGYSNTMFAMETKLPGDSRAQYYCVSATHSTMETVTFSIIVDPTQILTNVMRVKVELLVPNQPDQLLYDGLMKDCTGVDVHIPATGDTVTSLYYRITAYTNGAEVGNEYAGAYMTADFAWEIH